MGRKLLNSLVYNVGLCAIIFIILSLAFSENITIRVLYIMVCGVVPIHIFDYYTNILKLFSRHLWVRRMIVMLFAIFIMTANMFIFGYLSFELNKALIVFAASIALYVLLTVFIYYINDKIEKENLKAINKALSEKNSKNSE